MESIYIGLFARNDRTCRKERFGCTDGGIELYAYVSGGVIDDGNTIQERTGNGLSRFGLDVLDTAFANLLTMMADDIIKVEFVEIGKGEVVPYLYDKGYGRSRRTLMF